MDAVKKSIWGWGLYDWANSAFATTVMAGFFPIFFKQYWCDGINVNLSTARLGMGSSLASLAVALMAPILGAIADQGNARKTFLILFAYLGVLMTACLFLVGQGNWFLALLFYVMGNIGFAGSIVFYDAILPDIADKSRVDFVSSLGYALGYLGGGLLFLLNVCMARYPEVFGLPDAATAVRTSFLTVAVWWGGFTIFTILWMPGQPKLAIAPKKNRWVLHGLLQLADTLKKVRRLKTVMLFLLAYWFYIDGVDTIIRMAVDYGLSLGFKDTDLIVALLLVQFVGFPAALGFGLMGQRWGVRRFLFIAIAVYIAIAVWGAFMDRLYEFYILAVAIGCVQGGIQALSRSYYTRLIPPGQSAEFFGFYNMLGKFAAIIGPTLMGAAGLLTRHLLMPDNASPSEIAAIGQFASRVGILSIVLLFIAGAVLLYFVDEKKLAYSL